ncbi:MAG: hypothetical protein WC099_02260 [Candidatus Paceibacterota bacterium]
MENIGTRKYELNMANSENFSDVEIEEVALEISKLQGGVGGDVEQRSPEKMMELINKDLVLFLKNKDGEIIASSYLEPFPNGEENVYILGGLSSKETGALTGIRKELIEIMEEHRDKIIFARTKPRIANIFLMDMGFREVPGEEFKQRFEKDYIKYMSSQIKDFSLTEGVHTYVREKVA